MYITGKAREIITSIGHGLSREPGGHIRVPPRALARRARALARRARTRARRARARAQQPRDPARRRHGSADGGRLGHHEGRLPARAGRHVGFGRGHSVRHTHAAVRVDAGGPDLLDAHSSADSGQRPAARAGLGRGADATDSRAHRARPARPLHAHGGAGGGARGPRAALLDSV